MKRHFTLAFLLAAAPAVAAAQVAAPAKAPAQAAKAKAPAKAPALDAQTIAPATKTPAAKAPAVPAADAATAPAEVGQVRIEAGEGGNKTSNYDSGLSEINGDVTITQDGEDFILYAQKVVHSDKKNQATATGDLRIETRDSTIRSVKMFADFNTKIISMIDSVVISSYDEGDGIQTDGQLEKRAEKKRKPVRIACDRLDWNYETKQATLVGNLRIVQSQSVGTCDQIIYDEPKNAARLLGNVKFGNPQKRSFLTDELTLFVDSGQTQTDAGVRLIGPVNNVADGTGIVPPKGAAIQAFPEPAAIGDDATFPAPPADIEKFLPRPGVPPAPGKAAVVKTPVVTAPIVIETPTKTGEAPVAEPEPETPAVEK